MDLFTIKDNDTTLTRNLKRDFESFVKSKEVSNEASRKNIILTIALNISEVLPQNMTLDKFTEAVELIKDTMLYKTTMPVVFKIEDFAGCIHRTLTYIHKIDGNIINDKAYDGKIRKYYNHLTKSEITFQEFVDECKNTEFNRDIHNPIYISKGGRITGEYFDYAYFDHYTKLVDKEIKIPKIIDIPVSLIYYVEHGIMFCFKVVDHREPTLKQLLNTYHVKMLINEKVKSMKFDIRDYEKISNK